MQDLRMHWVSLEHNDDHAKVKKIARELFRGTTLIFPCPRKQGQSCEIKMIKEMVVRKQQGPVAL